jgi:hypothetical protein
MVPGADDTNYLYPEATTNIDWDAFVSDLESAADMECFVAVVHRYLAGVKLSISEQRLIAEILGLVTGEIDRQGLIHAAPRAAQRSTYARVLPEIWGRSWRHRRTPDKHELVVPLRQVAAPAHTIARSDVQFIGADVCADGGHDIDVPEPLQPDWSADAYARTVVEACDFLAAKVTGLRRIRKAMAAVGFVHSYTAWHQKVAESVYEPVAYERPAGAPGVIGSLVRIVNLRSGEYWLGSIRNQPEPCDLEQVMSLRRGLLSQLDCGDRANELLRHVDRAVSWRYRGLLAAEPVDAFLHTWLALEMLFERPKEKTPAMVRRLPFVFLSVGDSPSAIRSELQNQWVPLRDEVVHRALQSHPEIGTAVRRLRYFSDCAITYALARARQSPSYEDWLDHLDALSRAKPPRSQGTV